MKFSTPINLFIIILFSIFNSNQLFAENGEQSKKFGDYTIYYNAFNSSVLAANIAQQYGITRGSNTGVINISVHKGKADGKTAVEAFVSGSMKNLLAQSNNLKFKQVSEGEAIYYIATFQFNNLDNLSFEINLTPKTEKRGFNFRFKNQFYED